MSKWRKSSIIELLAYGLDSETGGAGIPAQVIDKVKQPFFSTRPKGKGTGLGLSISEGIIRECGGRLSIESVEGEFTGIEIDLPAGV
jgi:signal transduction histidine kinase